jgi:hypothetical protein
MRSAANVLAGLVAICLAAGCHDALVSRSIGARCDSSPECNDHCLPDGEGFPGGFCTVLCNSKLDCTVATECVELQGGVCLFECNDEYDCDFLGSGWECADVESREDPAIKVGVCRGL